MSSDCQTISVTVPPGTPPVNVCPGALDQIIAVRVDLDRAGMMQAGVSVRVIAIFAWPGATAEMIGCAGCDAQPAQPIAITKSIAPIPSRIVRERYGGDAFF
jgi:hypothetical protein